MSRFLHLNSLSLASLATVLVSSILSGQDGGDLRFRFLGPLVGNRIASVASVPGDPSVYYAGAASGGIWKSTDGGNRFTAIFDDQPVAAIGALAVAESDPNVVWAGTGEAWAIRDSDVMGNGIYKSVDAGKTWKHMGLDETGRIGKIVINPKNPDNVYACALGRLTGPQQERGVYRSNDGGQHWERTLFVDPNTGCSGLSMDPHNSRVLFAGMWQVEMHTYGEFSGGPGSGVFSSHDGGITWTRLSGRGLPRSPLGKIDVAVAPSNSNRVYALIQTANQGSIWRSDNGGETWRGGSHDRALIGRAGYYIRIGVAPNNENEVIVMNSSVHHSLDGGDNFTVVPWGGDSHDIWIDPTNADRFVITDDAGMNITTVHGQGFHRVRLPIGQMYHVAVDNQVPYWIYTNMQDNSTMRGPSTPRGGGGGGGGDDEGRGPNRDELATIGAAPTRATIPAQTTESRDAGVSGDRAAATEPGTNSMTGANDDGGPAAAPAGSGGRGARGGGGGQASAGQPVAPGADGWEYRLGGCESGFTYPDPADTNIIWASCYGDEVTRYDARTKEAHSVSPWIHTLDSPPNETKYRCHWTSPIAIDPFDHNTVYYGCQVVFKTSNAGKNWSVISPDLSTQDPSHNVSSGGIVADNLGQFYGEVVFAIAPSSIQKGLVWAGTNDGKLWYTNDGGGKWNDVTKNITGMAPWGVMSKIQPSVFDAGTAYVAVDYHLMDNRDPFIFKTTDFGKTWKQINGNLPKGPLAYVKSVTEDPNQKGLLFAGTGNGFYYSLNDGGSWTRFGTGLPPAPVTWIEVQKDFHDVVVSTYGRGIYILDDISPLEQMAANKAEGPVQLYTPRATYRVTSGGRAFINFRLNAAAPAEVKIVDANGNVVRAFRSAPGREGLNRKTWDLHYDAPQTVKLRTAAPDNPYIWNEPRFRNADFRTITHWGLRQAEVGPLVAPGKYTIQVTVKGQTYKTPIEVLKSPKTAASEAELEASLKLQLRIRDDINTTSDMVNRIEWMRKQMDDLRRMLRTQANSGELLRAVQSMDSKAQGVEYKLISKADANSDDKYFSQAYKIYLNLIWLNGEVGTGAGDVAGGANYALTDTVQELLAGIEKDLAAVKTQFRSLLDKDLPTLNRVLTGGGAVAVSAGN